MFSGNGSAFFLVLIGCGSRRFDAAPGNVCAMSLLFETLFFTHYRYAGVKFE